MDEYRLVCQYGVTRKMNPVDFFKTIEEKEDTRKEGVLLAYAVKIIKKYFMECIGVYELNDIINDVMIPYKDKQVAIREMADGLLQRVHIYNTKTDLHSLMTKGKNHDVVKELISAITEHDCDILIFPVYKASNWVAHCMGESDNSLKKPRIVIPGDGVSITIQDLDTFIKEHM